jgi:hypothetical protein
MLKKILPLLAVTILFCQLLQAQYLMDLIDTSQNMGKNMLDLYNRYDHLKLSGYIQPQFQLAQTKGELSYAGGNFAANSNSRFMLRRARVMINYSNFPKEGNGPSYQFVFQIDATERGVNVRDVWGQVLENKYKMFAFTIGLFARPISYEVNLSSAFRESPERGRMSQILMNTERDLGAMVTFEPRKSTSKLNFLRVDVGVFNGPGLPAPVEDYDSHKDIISRIVIKPQPLTKKITLGGSAGIYYGGLTQNTKYAYNAETVAGIKTFVVDSAVTNVGMVAPRKYYGADMQLTINNRVGSTQFRGEFLGGSQTASSTSTQTPGAAFTGTQGYYVRNFNGAYFYFLQNLGSLKHQVIIKYDWYDPNTFVKTTEIGAVGSNFNAADIKYQTLGVGYIYYMNLNIKSVLYYDFVYNEITSLPGYTANVKDNVLTLRIQFRF